MASVTTVDQRPLIDRAGSIGLAVLTVGALIIAVIAVPFGFIGVAASNAWTRREKVVAALIGMAMAILPFVLISSDMGDSAIGLLVFWYAAGPVAAAYLFISRRLRLRRSAT